MRRSIFAPTVSLFLAVLTPACTPQDSTLQPRASGLAPVNGLQMYYEVYGSGRPLVLLHGAYMSVPSAFAQLIPALARTRQVIAVELQGHGRTADIDRPIRYQHMADDVAALVAHLGLGSVDVFGYSMGGGVALQLALRHPNVVRKLAVASVSSSHRGMYPELLAFIKTITPQTFAGSPWEAEYQRLAPRPQDWPTFVSKLVDLDLQPFDWPVEQIRAPVFLIVGDADVIRPEHAVEMFRRLGGGVIGDMNPLPPSRFAVLPGASHLGVIAQSELLLTMIPPFLDAPMP